MYSFLILVCTLPVGTGVFVQKGFVSRVNDDKSLISNDWVKGGLKL